MSYFDSISYFLEQIWKHFLILFSFFDINTVKNSERLLSSSGESQRLNWKKSGLLLITLSFFPAVLFAGNDSFSATLNYGDNNVSTYPSPAGVTVTKNSLDLYTITVLTPGYVTVNFNDDSAGKVTFAVSTISPPTWDTGSSTSYGPSPYFVNDVLYITVFAGGETSLIPYELDVTLTRADIPVVSLVPDTKNVDPTTTSVNLFVSTTVCPFNDDINVTYTNEQNSTYTGYKTFEQISCVRAQPITVGVTPGLPVGSVYDINITCDDPNVCTLGSSTTTITVLDNVSDLSITKTAPAFVQIGSPFDFTLTVVNNGNSDAFDINITDVVDADLTLNSITASGWSCTPAANSNMFCTSNSNIAPGASSSIVLNVTAPATSGQIANTAYVVSGNDSNALNNESLVNVNIVDFNEASDICYFDSTGDKIASNLAGCSSADNDANLSYGQNCAASVDFGNRSALTILYDVNITKRYSRQLITGTCESGSTDCIDRKTSVDAESGYSIGYELDSYILNPLRSIKIEDENTDYTDTSDEDMDIIIYASYIKEGFGYQGQVYSCGGSGFSGTPDNVLGQLDIVNTLFNENDYNNGTGPVLTTKVVGRSMTVDIVYLGDDGGDDPENFTGVPFAAILELAENDGNGNYNIITPLYDNSVPPRLLTAELIPPNGAGVMSATSATFTIKEAHRDAKIVARYDYVSDTLSNNLEQCIERSATNGNLQDIASCLNSESKLGEAYVSTAVACLNIWVASNGQPYGPCTSNAGNSGFPLLSPYDTEPACLSCLIGPSIVAESKDNFAIRPEKLNLIPLATDPTTVAHFPDLLRAGHDYSISVNALNFGSTTNTVGYDQTINNYDPPVPPIRWLNTTPKNLDTGLLVGNADINTSTGATILDGVMTGSIGYAYSDVGFITMLIEDHEWASVDIDNPNDPTPEDCSADGAYICSDLNGTFIPDHFSVIITDLNNSSDGFTYLSNERNMTANIRVIVLAENEDGGITENFSRPVLSPIYRVLYENPVEVTMTVPPHPSLTFDVNTSTLGAVAWGFEDGEKILSPTDTNDTLAFWFHYIRETNVSVNPFRINGTDVVIDVNSTYTAAPAPDGAPDGTANINGTDTDDANLTYVYGRTHMARTRAMCDGTGSCQGNMTFYYEFYGDKDANKTLISNLLGTPAPRSLDSVNWYRNTRHDTANNDGNVTASTINSTSIVIGAYDQNGLVSPIRSTTSTIYNYSGAKGYPYKRTITVPQTTSSTGGTQSWLIYDKYKADTSGDAANSTVSGEVEYYGPGEWSSTGGAESSVQDKTDSTRNKNTNRRIRW